MKVGDQTGRQPPATPTAAMVRTLMGIAMLSGLLVVSAFRITAPMIAENQRQAAERAFFAVLPQATRKRDLRLTADGRLLDDPDGQGQGTPVYAGYDAEGRLLGIAAPAAAQGYAGPIELLYGYDPACRCIRGMQVLKLAETPGLGDRILTDAGFLANFQALDARLDASGERLAHPIVTVKHGRKVHPWQIDAISGATISSRAVGRAIERSASRLLPRLLPRLERLKTIRETPDES